MVRRDAAGAVFDAGRPHDLQHLPGHVVEGGDPAPRLQLQLLLNHFEFHASHPFCIRDIRRPLPAKPSELWGAGRPRVLLIEPLPDRAAGMDQGELLILIAGLLDERGR